MSRSALVLALALPLSGCVSVPSFHLPALTKKAEATVPIVAAAPVCSVAVSADLKPMPPVPDGAKIPAAQTADMSAGFALYLAWLKSLADWGREGWARVDRAHQQCAHPGGN
jgi:hypothetical protein